MGNCTQKLEEGTKISEFSNSKCIKNQFWSLIVEYQLGKLYINEMTNNDGN